MVLRLWGCPKADSTCVVERRHQFKASVSKFSCVGRARHINDALASEALLERFQVFLQFVGDVPWGAI